MSRRVAFASMGEAIDQHFGSARVWQIYDLEETGVFVETRKSAAKCHGNCEGGFEHLLELFQDCDAVFVSKIGEGAAAFMLTHGKRVFEASGDLEELIPELIEGAWLDEPEL